MPEAADPGAANERGVVWRAFAIFCATALAVAAAYLASAALFADLGVFAAPDGSARVARLPRFNAALGLVFAYLCASVWLGQRWAQRDFEALRGVAEASAADWSEWAARARAPGPATLACAGLAGAAFGVGVNLVGGRNGELDPALWRGHVVWVQLLNPLLFAVMGVLIVLGAARSRAYRELGRRTRVRVGEIASLAPFARAGLRVALLWFVGTSLASLLLVDTDSPALVLSILVGTTGIAVASLLAPSRGVHERLRAAKREELDWVRARIAEASGALRSGDERGAASLPALLAWEARVASAPEWPFDASTWLRFALLLLVPLGSWLGGALAQHVVERWLGA
jgi:hypothetical protein